MGAVGSLGAERTVRGGLGWDWDCLCVHVEVAGASKWGQAGSALSALSGRRGLWLGGLEWGWDCLCVHIEAASASNGG